MSDAEGTLDHIAHLWQMKLDYTERSNRAITEAVINGTLTQRRIAERLGISQPAVSQIAGRTLKIALAVEDITGASLSWLRRLYYSGEVREEIQDRYLRLVSPSSELFVQVLHTSDSARRNQRVIVALPTYEGMIEETSRVKESLGQIKVQSGALQSRELHLRIGHIKMTAWIKRRSEESEEGLTRDQLTAYLRLSLEEFKRLPLEEQRQFAEMLLYNIDDPVQMEQHISSWDLASE